MIKLFLVVVALLTFSACGSPSGDDAGTDAGPVVPMPECNESNLNKASCDGPPTFMICERSGLIAPPTWTRFPCHGGCEWQQNNTLVWCDFTGAQEGERCPTQLGALAVCGNSTSLLECRDGGWVARPCGTCSTTTSDAGVPTSSCTAP